MKIEVKLDGEKEGEERRLILDDEGFEARGFVSLVLEKHTEDEITEEVLGDVHVNDLMPALIAFDAKGSRLMEWDKQYLESHPIFTVDGKPLNTSL